MSAAVDADLARYYRDLDAAERYERAVELRAEDAYSDPDAVLQAVGWFADRQDTPGYETAARLIGEVLVHAMTWARAVHENPSEAVLGAAAGKLLATARALDQDEAFSDRMHAEAEIWVLASAQDAADYDNDARADYPEDYR